MRPALTLLVVLLTAVPASAKWYGSTMKGSANATYSCRYAEVFSPVSGISLTPTNQTSCTYKHGGYFNRTRLGSVVPGNGRIARIRVKSGPHPAKLRLTILTGSSRVDTTNGQDIPSTYTCCTARYIGKAFRPKANAVTVRDVDVAVYSTYSKEIQTRQHAVDAVAISAVGSGRLPLHLGSLGGYDDGTPIGIGFWPMTGKGDPRLDGYAMTGIDVLLGWDFRPAT